jgi:molecular chaperone GrpE
LRFVTGEFKKTLERHGVCGLEVLGKNFDPLHHEALGQEPGDAPSGTVTKEMTKGYTLHGRLLRPAQVVISTGIKIN